MNDEIHDYLGLGALILHALGPGGSVAYYRDCVLAHPECRVAYPLGDTIGVDEYLAAVPRIVEACDAWRAGNPTRAAAAEAATDTPIAASAAGTS